MAKAATRSLVQQCTCSQSILHVPLYHGCDCVLEELQGLDSSKLESGEEQAVQVHVEQSMSGEAITGAIL